MRLKQCIQAPVKCTGLLLRITFLATDKAPLQIVINSHCLCPKEQQHNASTVPVHFTQTPPSNPVEIRLLQASSAH